jgi:membrane protease YdiL (CAAX protease family)
MESNTISTNTLILILLIIVAAELLALIGIKLTALPYMAVLGVIRALEIAGILWAVIRWENGLATIGWAPSTWSDGLEKGAVWSMGFALAAGTGMLIVFIAGQNPLQWLRSPLPDNTLSRVLFFLVGGLIAPVAEEICFRGVIYTYLRDLGIRIGVIVAPKYADDDHGIRWIKVVAIIFAIATSTFVFTLLHAFRGIPVTQIVGGLVFALAYESSRNLMTPIVIHSLGNLALFTLSLF